MEGTIWRFCAIVLVLCAWHACAQKLVNLIEPLKRRYPELHPSKLWDSDTTTVGKVTPWCHLCHSRQDECSGPLDPLPDYHVQECESTESVPSDLEGDCRIMFDGGCTGASIYTVANVKGAVFKNGFIEGKFSQVVSMSDVEFKFDNDPRCADGNFVFLDSGYRIAEIELLGTREALDALQPFEGAYPCDQGLSMIAAPDGPAKLFVEAVSFSDTRQEELRTMFNAVGPESLERRTFRFAGDEGKLSILVGAEFPEDLPMVNAVQIKFGDYFLNGFNGKFSNNVCRVEIEGSFCEPKWRYYKTEGWVNLGQLTNPGVHVKPVRNRIYVEKADQYKAYRLKLYTRDQLSLDTKIFKIFFVGCASR